MSLPVKYRPETFDSVCGQSITVKILQKMLESRNFKNCYLFAGKSGSGKTTCARIFARGINNNVGKPYELDCASNNSVDNVRELIEQANQRDLVAEYKVFILDECHYFSGAAWSALLKLIEECPKYTILIFCTTNPEKIPEAILNRMQRFNFAPISPTEIRDHLLYICQQEGFTNYTDSCDLISKASSGSMREAITTLEQCADLSTDLTVENVKSVISGISYETLFKLTWAISNKNQEDIFTIIDSIVNQGQDLKVFLDSYIKFILDLAKYTLFKDISLTGIPTYLSTENNPVVQYTTKDKEAKYFNKLADLLLEAKQVSKYDQSYNTTILLYLIKAMEVAND